VHARTPTEATREVLELIGGLYAIEADILVSKYADHAPLYRQSQIAARDGVKLDPASMGRWVGQCEALCDALTEALRRYTVAPSKLHADDTPIPVLEPGKKKTKTGAPVGVCAR